MRYGILAIPSSRSCQRIQCVCIFYQNVPYGSRVTAMFTFFHNLSLDKVWQSPGLDLVNINVSKTFHQNISYGLRDRASLTFS